METTLHKSVNRSSAIKLQVNAAKFEDIQVCCAQAWQTIAPLWTLQNFIAKNPLSGFENQRFETALARGAHYFQQADIPEPLQHVNRETIKWCQAFFDQGQAAIAMPGREQGLYRAWKSLALYDAKLYRANTSAKEWLASLPNDSFHAVEICLRKLHITPDQITQAMTLMLPSLPGWAGHVKYLVEWTSAHNPSRHPVSFMDFLAIRLAITCLLWPKALDFITSHFPTHSMQQQKTMQSIYSNIQNAEAKYRTPLLKQLQVAAENLTSKPQESALNAQLIFCIDVRSEPFRRAIESEGNYATLGFAGFFGLPIAIEGGHATGAGSSCPVLLKPKHIVKEVMSCCPRSDVTHSKKQDLLKKLTMLYHSLKYNFTTPLALVETLGPWLGGAMILRTINQLFARKVHIGLQQTIRPLMNTTEDIGDIAFADQCNYTASALRIMGLTSGFAPLVVLCGHGSATQNNPYATALDCGACAGRHGGVNAKVLAGILNQKTIRDALRKQQIDIPDHVVFIGAAHITTTDELVIYPRESMTPQQINLLQQLEKDLQNARQKNNQWRCQQMHVNLDKPSDAINETSLRSIDWAQTQPEWGLARNAAFIIGPRQLTKNINLEGRSFLHSYDWRQDADGSSLETILTAPMVVTQWINTQYLFSTIDNVAYGSGSKITQNITGKIGIMQGNASDLMQGLAMQSVALSDTVAYHEPLRLMTVVYAPCDLIDPLIKKHAILQRLFGNGWVTLAAINPLDNAVYLLQQDFSWHS